MLLVAASSCQAVRMPDISRIFKPVMRAGASSTLPPKYLPPKSQSEGQLTPSQSCGTLILMRHGKVEVPSGSSFVGWSDPDLSDHGEKETTEAARAILEAGHSVDVVYTSMLKRAVRTTWLLLRQLQKIYLPVYKHWRLNERCYGALTREPVDVMQSRYGQETVASWRRTMDARPPPFPADHPHDPSRLPRYTRFTDRNGKMGRIQIPDGETLRETIDRCMPIWKREILPDLRRGRNVLVVAHGNTIRAIVSSIDDLSDDEICELEVPSCIPLVYRFTRKSAIYAVAEGAMANIEQAAAPDGAVGRVTPLAGVAAALRGRLRRVLSRRLTRDGTMRPRRDPNFVDLVPVPMEAASYPLSGEYLAKPTVVAAAKDEVRAASLARYGVNGHRHGERSGPHPSDGASYGAFLTPTATSSTPLAIYKPQLPVDRLAPGAWHHLQAGGTTSAEEGGGVGHGSDNHAETSHAVEGSTAHGNDGESKLSSHSSESVTSHNGRGSSRQGGSNGARREVITLAGGGTLSRQLPKPRPQYVVIIRHGKTENNKMGLFTGWDDVSLAKEGRVEAAAAGQLLAAHDITFDVVYTSWLSRAIETAWLVLVEMDALWVPIRRTWRLNERMYGALTGLSKKHTRTNYGEAQFKRWRRGYDTKPPPVSSFSHHYPGNDQRYVDNVVDVRPSIKETVVRSIESGRLTLHPKLPHAESLKDCMERTIPYWIKEIEGEAIRNGKSVLVASSENAIRGLLMHLLHIPASEISSIEIPTGLPLVFDMRHRCLRLLEGDFADYNFGSGADLLFTPCEVAVDDDYDELSDNERLFSSPRPKVAVKARREEAKKKAKEAEEEAEASTLRGQVPVCLD